MSRRSIAHACGSIEEKLVTASLAGSTPGSLRMTSNVPRSTKLRSCAANIRGQVERAIGDATAQQRPDGLANLSIGIFVAIWSCRAECRLVMAAVYLSRRPVDIAASDWDDNVSFRTTMSYGSRPVDSRELGRTGIHISPIGLASAQSSGGGAGHPSRRCRSYRSTSSSRRP